MNNIKFKTLAILLLGYLSVPVAGYGQQPSTNSNVDYYIKIALSQNPLIESQRVNILAAHQDVEQAGAFADPELSAGVYTKPMDIVGGKSVADFTIMQMLPWFGTKKAAKTEANHMVEMKVSEYVAAKQALIFSVKSQWYVLLKTQEQINNAHKNKELLIQLEQLALRKFSSVSASGSSSMSPSVSAAATTPSQSPTSSMTMAPSTSTASGSQSASTSTEMSQTNSPGMSDVLRVGLEIMEIENTLADLHADLQGQKAVFNALLNLAPDTPIDLDQQIEQEHVLFDPNSALAEIDNHNPMLSMLTEQGLAYRAKAEMDRKMSYPMLGIGVQYMVIGKTNDPMLAMGNMNGQDMIMPMVSVSLPIFRKKYNALQKQSELYRQSNTLTYQDTRNNLHAQYYTLSKQLENKQRLIDLLKKQTTLAESTFSLIIKEFTANKSDLTNVIQVQRQLLGYQLQNAQAIADYNTLVSQMKQLMANNEPLSEQ